MYTRRRAATVEGAQNELKTVRQSYSPSFTLRKTSQRASGDGGGAGMVRGNANRLPFQPGPSRATPGRPADAAMISALTSWCTWLPVRPRTCSILTGLSLSGAHSRKKPDSDALAVRGSAGSCRPAATTRTALPRESVAGGAESHRVSQGRLVPN